MDYVIVEVYEEGFYMQKVQFSIIDHKQQIPLKANQMAVYLQSKIVEAIDENNEIYYLLFYKANFLTCFKANSLRRRTFIENAFKKGIVFEAPHPLIDSLISQNHSMKVRTFNQLLKKTQNNYTPQETALIATYFDAFIQKEQIIKLIQTIFYNYRRNGKMLSAYKILRIAKEFAPKNNWVQPLANHIDFYKIALTYQKHPEKLIEKDRLYVERFCYSHKKNEQYEELLYSLLTQESRWIDLVALYLDKLTSMPNSTTFNALSRLLERHFTEQETTQVLSDLYQSIPHFPELQQHLLEKLIKFHNNENAINLMINQNLPIDPSLYETVEEMVENLNFNSELINIEKLNTFILPLFQSQLEKKEEVIKRCVTTLLKKSDITAVTIWLSPLENDQAAQPFIVKLKQMEELANNPDQQLQLGQLYYQFEQLDKALECFSWEMELNPDNPVPVQWLSKIYQEKGFKHESQAYQQLFIDMRKRA